MAGPRSAGLTPKKTASDNGPASELASTRRRVMTAALQLFASKGYAATGIRDIAEAAGVPAATLYHYMVTKEDLLVDIMVRNLKRSIMSGRAAVAGQADPARELVALTRVHVATVALQPLMSLVTDQEIRALSQHRRPEVLPLRDRYEELWVGCLHRGRDAGTFSLIDDTLVRLALLEMGNGVAQWYSPEGRLSIDQLADRYAAWRSLVEASPDGMRLRVGEPGHGSGGR